MIVFGTRKDNFIRLYRINCNIYYGTYLNLSMENMFNFGKTVAVVPKHMFLKTMRGERDISRIARLKSRN